MTVKTPEQLADEICNAQPSDWAAARWTMKPEDVRASIIAAIEADRAQREPAVAVMRQGELTEDPEIVQVIDVSFVDGRGWSEYDQDNIDSMVATLRAAGFDSAADDVEEWWSAGKIAPEDQCDECEEEATNHWPNLKEPVKLCASCEHNARRSGWEPGQ